MNTSEQINEISSALSKAQGMMRPAIKDANNPAYKSRYADLTSVWDACRIPLSSNGIAVLQDVTCGSGGISVTTRLLHNSGQWVEVGPLTVPLAKMDAHGVGSATSYAKRYALSAAVGIVSDDDDGNAAASSAPQARMSDKAIADLKSSLNEAATLDDLRERTAKALSIAHQGGDVEAHADIKDYAGKIAAKMKKAA